MEQEELFDNLVDTINKKYDEPKPAEIKTEDNHKDRKKLK